MLKARATWCGRRSPSTAKNSVHTSSTSVYGKQAGIFDETAPKLGRNSLNYQRSKAAAEDEVAQAIAQGLDAVLLNPANVIGRYDWSTWSQFIRLAANRQLFRIPPGRACYADVGAVVRAHVAAVEKGRTGENYILGGTEASYAEIVQIVGRLLGQPTNTAVGRAAVLRLAGRVLERISAITGKEPIISEEIGCDGDGEHRLPKRQGHARAGLPARSSGSHAQGLHRLDGCCEPHQSTRGSVLAR